MPEISPPYRRVYFDSNVLLRLQWPRLSPTILSAIGVLNDFHIPAILLDTVERELREHILRGLIATKTDAESKAATLVNACKALGIRVRSISLPSIPKIESGYD